MRLTGFVVVFALLFCCASARVGHAQPSPLDRDTLGPLVVEATRAEATSRRPRLTLAIEPSLDASPADVLLHSIVERDLALTGDFSLLPVERMPPGAVTSDAPPDLPSWRRTSIDALLRLSARSTDGGQTRFMGIVYLLRQQDEPVFSAALTQPASTRLAAHALADALVGALTGRSGSFCSRLTFTQSRSGARRAFTIDADGHGLRIASGAHELVSASAFGPGDQLFFAASVEHGRYGLYPPPRAPLSPNGSVYGISFDPSRERVALAIASGRGVRIFAGPSDFRSLRAVSKNELALHPTYSAMGKLAYVGVDGVSSRVYVDGHAVSPRGLRAGSPAFCDHPGGLRLVYAAQVGRRTHLIVADEGGRNRRWLTGGDGDETDAACSPDGRLVAFFASASRSRRAGLYVVPLEGGEPQRISTTLGDTLRWSKIIGVPTVETVGSNRGDGT